MPKRLKVMTVVGIRPEVIRLSSTLKLLDEHTDHVLVHTGQNYDYELNEVFFNAKSHPPTHFASREPRILDGLCCLSRALCGTYECTGYESAGVSPELWLATTVGVRA